MAESPSVAIDHIKFVFQATVMLGVSPKIAGEITIFALLLFALLFGGAGTLEWSGGWVFLALFFGPVVLITVDLTRRDPALLRERARLPFQAGQPVWDRALTVVLGAVFLAWLAFMGADAVRFGWSRLPVWLRLIGSVAMLTAYWIIHLALRANTFAVCVVKIQTDRAQYVVQEGPYTVVRHPMYAGAILVFFGAPLILGSAWGLVGGMAISAGIVVRTILEDHALRAGLEGYSEYARRVSKRILPGVW